jgi:hypothetical protein
MTLIPNPDKYKSLILNATVPKSCVAGSFIETPDRLLKLRLGQPLPNPLCQYRPNIMDLPNAIERLRNVRRRQHKAIATNFKVP